MSKTHTVVISNDIDEAEQFAAWLNTQGHTASIGRSTGSYIDGVWTSTDPDASELFNAMWSGYCNS